MECMKISGKIVVVTGGAHGIGQALCKRFAAEGAKAVVVADRDFAGAEAVAKTVGGLAVKTDVSKETDILALVEKTTAAYGPVDVFCSNAGIGMGGGVEVSNEKWQLIWEVNLMAHVWAARAVLPSMIARGSGYLVNVASAAGLLTSIGTAPYAVTKHAAVSLAEWLAITHGDQGIRVSVVCPLGVNTEMLTQADQSIVGATIRASGPVIEADDVAAAVLKGMDEERFLITPHPEATTMFAKKASDMDRYVAGMRKQVGKIVASMKG